MTDLFAAQPRQTHDPRVHICAACGRPNAPCGIGSQWWCWPCAPDERAPKAAANRE